MNLRKVTITIALALLLSLSLASPSTAWAQDEDSFSWTVAPNAVAPILDQDGKQIGLVAVGVEDGPGIVVIVEGLAPGEHGIHLHETGQCETKDDTPFGAAGGHFNPGNMSHPDHAGDLGNLNVSESGSSMFFSDLGAITFDDGAWGLMDDDGTALMIHETVDDLATDPSGNSGGRVACAVIAPPIV